MNISSKVVIVCIVVILSSSAVFGQISAVNYFPGYAHGQWLYRVAPLDTMQRAVDSLAVNQVIVNGSDAVFEGRSAKILKRLTSISDTMPLPFPDTSYLSFNGSIASMFMAAMPALESGQIPDSLGIGTIAAQVRGWHEVFQFSAVLGVPYMVFSKDTTLPIDSIPVPVRIYIQGKRIADQNVTVKAGTFNACKRFVITFGVGVPVTQTITIPLVTFTDSVSIASGAWIVREILPAQKLDLSYVGAGVYWIPGGQRELVSLVPPANAREHVDARPDEFALVHCYPNPFNPSVMIEYHLAHKGLTSVKVFDVIGREVAELASGDQGMGIHSVRWNAPGNTSGTFFVRLEQNGQTVTKAIQLIK